MRKFVIPEKELSFIKALEIAGFPSYVVGGAVRDFLIGKEYNDIDIATKATPSQIASVLLAEDKSIKLDFVGATFGVIIADGVEIATFRNDDYTASAFENHKDVRVSFVKDIETDLARRDFTINALAIDRRGKIIDLFGGSTDIDIKAIRFVGDPEKRINEDPTRILRAFRIATSLGFSIDVSSWTAIVNNIHKIRKIAPERVRLELFKALKVKEAGTFFSFLAASGALEILIPELAESLSHPGGKHHLENVWEHNILVGDSISPKFPLVKLAGYLHDIGKPESFGYDEEKDNWHFHGHHHTGAKLTKKVLKRLRFSSSEVEKISGLVNFHMEGYKTGNKYTPKTVRKVLTKLDSVNVHIDEFLRLRIADRKGNIARDPYSISEIKVYIESFKKIEVPPFSVNDLVVSGGELIHLFGFKPGRHIGEIHKFLLELVIENGAEFNVKNILIIEAKNFISVNGERAWYK